MRSRISSTSSAGRWPSSRPPPPRPRAARAARGGVDTPHQRRRREVEPGLTGWAQVNGRAGIPWEERIELDVWYVDNRSPRLDLRILARTLRLLASGPRLYG